MSQPFGHPECHFCQQTRAGSRRFTGSCQTGGTGEGNCPARNQHTDSSMPSAACAQVVTKKKMINKDKWRRAEHAGNSSPSFLFFPKQIKL